MKKRFMFTNTTTEDLILQSEVKMKISKIQKLAKFTSTAFHFN